MIKNISLFSGIGTNSPSFLPREKEGKKTEGNTIFYGNLTTNRLVDPIEARKKEAQKRAFQVVGNAWAADRKIDEDMQERRKRFLWRKCLRWGRSGMRSANSWRRLPHS